MLDNVVLVFSQLRNFSVDLRKNVNDRLVGVAADPLQERITGFNIQLNRSDSCAILTQVVLFFHQQVQLVDTPHDGSILLLIIRERLAQADECKSAFMFYFITHALTESAKVRQFLVLSS